MSEEEKKKGPWYENVEPLEGGPFSHINTNPTWAMKKTVSAELKGLLEDTGFVVDGEIQPLFEKKTNE